MGKHNIYMDLMSRERGTVIKDPGGRLNICLVYPNTYRTGMSNLGFTGIYSLLNQMDNVVCERAFLPEEHDITALERSRSQLSSVESGRALSSFDVIAFSISFENDYPNAIRILSLAGIKVLGSERGDGDPLVILGGPCAFINPEPLAEFMDCIFIGEAEETLDDMVNCVISARDRAGRLRSLARIKGFYIPSYYSPVYKDNGELERMDKLVQSAPDRIERVIVENIDSTILRSTVLSPDTEFSNMYLIEAMRGCPFSCRFCAAGHVYDPPRQRSVDVIEGEIAKLEGEKIKVGLIAPSLSDHKDINDLIEKNDVQFSITSLRANKRSAGLVRKMKNKRSVSIAPEAGSQRLRDVVKKKVTEANVISSSKAILESGIKKLRLYFMVGLPTESENDVDAIVELVKRVRSASKRGAISVTLSIFVPKPFTPFQWCSMVDIKLARERIKKIRKALSKKGVRVSHDPVRDAYVQGILANGDRRLSKFIIELSRGANLKEALKASGTSMEHYVHRTKAFKEKFPWEIIDNGIQKDRLYDQYKKAIGQT